MAETLLKFMDEGSFRAPVLLRKLEQDAPYGFKIFYNLFTYFFPLCCKKVL